MTLPRYSEYKSSGSPWFGTVPRHWEPTILKRIVAFVESGVSVNAVDEPAGPESLGVLKTSCVYAGVFNPGENKAVLPDELKRVACPVKAGTLVVSRMNTPALVGAAGLVTESVANLFLPDRLWQVHFANAEPKFVHYWTNTPSYRAQVQMACAGTSASMQNLSQDEFLRFTLPLPPLAEQTAIAAFLDRETTKIDALIIEQEKLIALLVEKRETTISHLVSKGLNPDAPMKDSGVTWLGEVPLHWKVRRLKQVVRPGVSISYGIVQPGEPLEHGVPFVQTSNMSDASFHLENLQRTTPEIAAAYPRSRLLGGEVILGIRASIGAAYTVPSHLAGANLSRGIARIECGNEIDPKYLVQVLRSSATENYWGLSKQGSTFSEVSIETVRELSFALPPPSEQALISKYLDIATAKLDALKKYAERAVALLKERRSALITAAVTGQIDVRKADTAQSQELAAAA